MSCVLGIDIGSAHSKCVLLSEGKVIERIDRPSGGDFAVTADELRRDLLARTGISPEAIERTIATGYGAKSVGFASDTRSDITCHSMGVHLLLPSARTVIDVGDLYSKVFKVDGRGHANNFLLSGKCAGGSGRVLQVIAKVLHVPVEDIGEMSLRSKNRVDFNTGCVVFAESEAVSRIAEGVPKEDLLAGIHRALAAQIYNLAERLGIETELALVGGGARDVGLVKALEEISGGKVLVPEEPHMTAALGAAIIAETETMEPTEPIPH
ncbi:MAG: 2-hydroxyglutaryl-CoA dehydratase [Deltaproteobacteria bacterium]|nr:2-hydroxyglutaryl-CoA dehydratase [Deltaproteobacteria bacterium]MBW2016653.1 2-hydroxyglutaryl-CoA dehydratase [Deltaproteobacteria bacterium]MBW2128815.1 2-hydroxyglutaryl-CoA dehydratase [Deltaproteobacteria bacterium]MBW2303761.1 2-hydroxyglutaryl-CoA dehydratase [Deltaproteobacteria bacterium]